jgi:hypothetical protein
MTTVIPAGQRTRNAELVRDLYGTLHRERRLEHTDRFFPLTWSGGGPSGLPLEMRTCDRFRIERGMVAEHWEAVDHLALGRAGRPTP